MKWVLYLQCRGGKRLPESVENLGEVTVDSQVDRIYAYSDLRIVAYLFEPHTFLCLEGCRVQGLEEIKKDTYVYQEWWLAPAGCKEEL